MARAGKRVKDGALTNADTAVIADIAAIADTAVIENGLLRGSETHARRSRPQKKELKRSWRR
jgi:hypothetical protein